MRHILRCFLAFFFLLSISIPVCRELCAELIRLRSGRAIHAEVLERDEEGVKVRDLAKGGTMFIRWDQMMPQDAAMLKGDEALRRIAEALRSSTGLLINGHRVVLIAEGGSIHSLGRRSFEGLIIEETAEKIVLKTSLGTLGISRLLVERIDDVKLDPLRVYSAREFYEIELAKRNPSTAEEHFAFGEFCEKLNLLSEARWHFQKSAELDPLFVKGVSEKLASFSERDAESLLSRIQALIEKNKLDKAQELLDTFVEKFQHTRAAEKIPEIKGALDAARKELAARKEREEKAELLTACYAALRRLLKTAAGRKDVSFDDVRTYATSALLKEMIDEAARQTRAERAVVENSWTTRNTSKIYNATYGSGTWIVQRSVTPSPDGSSLDDLARRKTEEEVLKRLNEAQELVPEEQRLTPEKWWSTASFTERFEWLEAYVAEKLLKVINVLYRDCFRCDAKGFISEKQICSRCQGVGVDRIVYYR